MGGDPASNRKDELTVAAAVALFRLLNAKDVSWTDIQDGLDGIRDWLFFMGSDSHVDCERHDLITAVADGLKKEEDKGA